MEILRGGIKAPVATDWATNADVINVGTKIKNSTGLYLAFNTWPDFVKLIVDVRITMQVTGGTGKVLAWLKILGYNSLIDTPDTAQGDKYTTQLIASTIANSRRILVDMPPVIQNASSTGTDKLLFIVQGRGENADTKWAITNIKARGIYIPL